MDLQTLPNICKSTNDSMHFWKIMSFLSPKKVFNSSLSNSYWHLIVLYLFNIQTWIAYANEANIPLYNPFLRSVSVVKGDIFAFILREISLGSYYDGEWHHVCIVWKNKKGSWKFFVDGAITDSGSNFQAGHVIRGGGVVIIGQVQNFAPGDPSGFQYSQGFVGRITGMNLWDFIPPQDEVLRMSQTCSMEIGNVLQWLDFENNYHCNVILENPSSCPNAQHWSKKFNPTISFKSKILICLLRFIGIHVN